MKKHQNASFFTAFPIQKLSNIFLSMLCSNEKHKNSLNDWCFDFFLTMVTHKNIAKVRFKRKLKGGYLRLYLIYLFTFKTMGLKWVYLKFGIPPQNLEYSAAE